MTNIIMLGCNGRMGQMITDIVAKVTEAQIVAGIDIVTTEKIHTLSLLYKRRV